MAKCNLNALALIALALASCQAVDAEVMTAIAEQCGIDEQQVYALADEVMTAKGVAETDMKTNNPL